MSRGHPRDISERERRQELEQETEMTVRRIQGHGLKDTNLSKSWEEKIKNKETDSALQPLEGAPAAWCSGFQNLQLTNVCCFKLLT